jgi:cytochrome c553
MAAGATVAAANQSGTITATPAQAEHFESKVRPVFLSKCIACHGDKQQIAGLRLDKPISPAMAKKVAAAVEYNGTIKMPPGGKMGAQDIAAVSAWGKAGGPWPAKVAVKTKQRFWAFVPPTVPSLPKVKNPNWAKSPLDVFVLAKLEEKGLKPAPPADKVTLIRRATFDLTGLPPTPSEIDAFTEDKSPKAFEKVLDRLLASTAYGERWGRHWLDVARYSDSNGLDENLVYVNAWRYRDWVIEAINQDKPINNFLREQIAGDLLPGAGDSQVVATGYLALGGKMLAEDDPQKQELDIIDEQVDTLSKGMLAMTVGCARCHDHKFDPISAKDYYSLASIFKSTKTMDKFTVVAEWQERTLGPKEPQEQLKKIELSLKEKSEARDKVRQKERGELLAKIQPEKDAYIVAAKLLIESKKPPEPVTPGRVQTDGQTPKGLIPEVVAGVAEQIKSGAPVKLELPENSDHLFPPPKVEELKVLNEEIKTLDASKPTIPRAMAVSEAPAKDLRVHVRGSYLTLGENATRGVPAIMSAKNPVVIPKDKSGRLELANWIASAKNPLTARVFVNRVWRWKFGKGLVGSVDNFGILGNLPTHPELLDWLATSFVTQDKWSLKQFQKRIMLTSTYQMSTRYDAKFANLDPENRYLWRFNRRRLEAEAIRDSIFFVSGTLDRKMGGTMMNLPPRAYVTNDQSANPIQYDSPRRAVYLPVIRANVYDVYTAFDFGDPTVMNGDRASTTVAPQALFMLNGKIVLTATKAQASNLLARKDIDDRARIQSLFRTCFGRPAKPKEVDRSLSYLSKFEQAYAKSKEPKLSAWQSLCKTMIGSNEFIYVE